jgi:hypothetical protein
MRCTMACNLKNSNSLNVSGSIEGRHLCLKGGKFEQSKVGEGWGRNISTRSYSAFEDPNFMTAKAYMAQFLGGPVETGILLCMFCIW